MDAKQIVQFKKSLSNMSLEELQAKRAELRDKIAKMILDCDITMQIAIIEAQIKEKDETADGKAN